MGRLLIVGGLVLGLAPGLLAHDPQEKAPRSGAEIYYEMSVERAMVDARDLRSCYKEWAISQSNVQHHVARIADLEGKLDNLDPHWRERK